MSLSFPGEFPGKDRTDFVVGPVASPVGVPKEVHGIWYGSPSESVKPVPEQPSEPEVAPVEEARAVAEGQVEQSRSIGGVASRAQNLSEWYDFLSREG